MSFFDNFLFFWDLESHSSRPVWKCRIRFSLDPEFVSVISISLKVSFKDQWWILKHNIDIPLVARAIIAWVSEEWGCMPLPTIFLPSNAASDNKIDGWGSFLSNLSIIMRQKLLIQGVPCQI